VTSPLAAPTASHSLAEPRRPREVEVRADAVDRLFVHVEVRIAELTPTAPRRAALYALDSALLRLMDRLALHVSEASRIRMAAVCEGERPDGGSEVWVWVHKKGNKPREYPLSGVVLTAYLRWLYLRKEVTAGPRHEDYLFIHPWTGYRVSRQRAWHRLKRLARKAGLPLTRRRGRRHQTVPSPLPRPWLADSQSYALPATHGYQSAVLCCSDPRRWAPRASSLSPASSDWHSGDPRAAGARPGLTRRASPARPARR
jgi:hypothetical protein